MCAFPSFLWLTFSTWTASCNVKDCSFDQINTIPCRRRNYSVCREHVSSFPLRDNSTTLPDFKISELFGKEKLVSWKRTSFFHLHFVKYTNYITYLAEFILLESVVSEDGKLNKYFNNTYGKKTSFNRYEYVKWFISGLYQGCAEIIEWDE